MTRQPRNPRGPRARLAWPIGAVLAVQVLSPLSAQAGARGPAQESSEGADLRDPGPALGSAWTAPPDRRPTHWEQLDWAGRGEVLSAVAFDPASGRLAVGDAKGVALWRPASPGGEGPASGSGAAGRIARSEGVGDLAFAADGALWIAAADGLWRFQESRAVGARAEDRSPAFTSGARLPLLEDRSPAPGEAAQRAHRVAVLGELVAVATEAGVYVSRNGAGWRRIDGVRSAVSALALRPAAAPDAASSVVAAELWMAAPGGPWRVLVAAEDGGVALRSLRYEVVPGAPAQQTPVDLRVDFGGAAVAILYPGVLALRADGAEPDWRVWRPVLPAGAEARRIGAASGRLWLATDRGLLESSDARMGWRRSAPPAARASVTALAAAGSMLFAAGERGLLRGRSDGRAGLASAASGASWASETGETSETSETSETGGSAVAMRPGDASPQLEPSSAGVREASRAAAALRLREPSAHAVQQMALRYLALDGAEIRSLRRQAARRGWLPSLDLRFGYGDDRDRGEDFDQTFVSGATRSLVDHDWGRSRDWDAAVSLSWDLSDLVFDRELVDAAREERQWIALRDDVLDEVGQLYFERQRTLLEIARRAQGSAAPHAAGLVSDSAAESETARLRLRAEELAAGLDGWTGGAFSRALAAGPTAASGRSSAAPADFPSFDGFDRARPER